MVQYSQWGVLMKLFRKLTVLLLSISLLSGCETGYYGRQSNLTTGNAFDNTWQTGMLLVEYINVGQGDSSLSIFPDGKVMLIDGGEVGQGSTVLKAMEEHHIKKIDYLVATHPHSDHIGGLAEVLSSVPTEKIIMPRIADESVPTTLVYENFLDAIYESNAEVIEAKSGLEIYQKNNLSVMCLAPVQKSAKNLNNYSAVIRIAYGNTSFLFTGDAENAVEKQLIKSGQTLKSNVLKAGHHGSSTASSDEFLQAVQPSYAVISSGAGNSYGHPHDNTLKRLEKVNAQVFRTDQQGSITATSDSETIDFYTERGKS